ncbi:hypothetical protein [Tenacibaculum sp. 190524A02b]|uniref:hypothetical protein n=1 Tax=Tenacibaculum vairaonense TaxID=3137860 RepID=UPI0031FB04CF
MKLITNKYLFLAIGMAVLFHGSAIFYTLEQSYDALIHLFFAEHYANNWQEPWSYKWYTGFSTMGYPPLVHQTLAILSFISGFKFALFSFTFIVILLFVSGVYRFSLLITSNKNHAGFAAIFAVFSSVFIETLHLFGQLPALTGIALLMHSLPETYKWLRTKKLRYLFSSLSLMSLITCSHHVTAIFGIVFFILPLFGLAIMDNAKAKKGNYKNIDLLFFLKELYRSLKHTLIFSFSSILLMIVSILPYWININKNPITQVPIPHGSRDNLLEVLSSGLVFFIIPYGVTLVLLPYLFYRFFSKRLLFFGISLSMLFLLGTGGTTPLPKIILGENAFSILTLDRFSFWAAIMSYPIMGEFFYRFIKTDYKVYLHKKLGKFYYVNCFLLLGSILVFFAVFTLNIGKFRPSQPRAIKMLPIVNFLNQDMHYKWRYLTLGFGDQMAWLASQTPALSVDGNYHSARRLPELTTKAVERLENSKYRGFEGIGSLQQFLANPEKFNLKYIFSNDKFYDPILFLTGWEKISLLENGIIVWEKKNVKPLANILPKIDIPLYQKLIWSFFPISILSVNIVWFLFSFLFLNPIVLSKNDIQPTSKGFSLALLPWNLLLFFFFIYGMYLFYIENTVHYSPKNVVKAYYDALDFKQFTKAHSYLDEDVGKPLDQFMLEISVSDGLLSSYAKLENINTTILKKKEDTIFIKAKTKWITPLEIVNKNTIIKTIKKKNKWVIIPEKASTYKPSNQFFNTTETIFYNQGRRKITTQQTHHEDILPQPIAYIYQAKLIKKDNQYHIIGELQNIDYFPSAISLKAILYDENNVELASYSSKFENKHYLNPFEKTVFKIDFEEIAWINSNKNKLSFNPKEFHAKRFKQTPTKFVLHVSTTVATKNLYQQVQINDLNTSKNKITGMLFNTGNKEVTIPQLLIPYYENDTLHWVDHLFLKESIRPHRKGFFEYVPVQKHNVKTITSTTNNCYVNGIQNEEGTFDRLDGFNFEKNKAIMLQNNNFKLKFQVVNFIGN